MNRINPLHMLIYWLFTLTTFIALVVMTFAYAPVEVTMGPVQKIFYLHMPMAINTFLACLVNFFASLMYLARGGRHWDDLAEAAARVAVLLCAVVLMTGMVWGRSAWGLWWTWSPRLTFSLVLGLLYVVYLVIRPSIESGRRRATICAIYGIIAFLDVPLVYLSVRLMPDIHPTSITLDHPAMRHTLIVGFIAVTLLNVGLIAIRYRLARHTTAPVHEYEVSPRTPLAQATGGVL